MILLAVIIGYILGISPYVAPKIIELIQKREEQKIEVQEDKKTAEIVNEWLNGPQEDNETTEDIDNRNRVNQQDIYNEYMTGITTPKGD